MMADGKDCTCHAHGFIDCDCDADWSCGACAQKDEELSTLRKALEAQEAATVQTAKQRDGARALQDRAERRIAELETKRHEREVDTMKHIADLQAQAERREKTHEAYAADLQEEATQAYGDGRARGANDDSEGAKKAEFLRRELHQQKQVEEICRKSIAEKDAVLAVQDRRITELAEQNIELKSSKERAHEVGVMVGYAMVEDEARDGVLGEANKTINALREQITELAAKVADYEETYTAVIDETCVAPDEKHCTCVPWLRSRINEQSRTNLDLMRALAQRTDEPALLHRRINEWAERDVVAQELIKNAYHEGYLESSFRDTMSRDVDKDWAHSSARAALKEMNDA